MVRSLSSTSSRPSHCMEIGLQLHVPTDFIPLQLSKVPTLRVPQSQYEHSVDETNRWLPREKEHGCSTCEKQERVTTILICNPVRENFAKI
jgi:hypothetical protein